MSGVLVSIDEIKQWDFNEFYEQSIYFILQLYPPSKNVWAGTQFRIFKAGVYGEATGLFSESCSINFLIAPVTTSPIVILATVS